MGASLLAVAKSIYYLCCQITENVWKNSRFLNGNKGLLYALQI